MKSQDVRSDDHLASKIQNKNDVILKEEADSQMNKIAVDEEIQCEGG